MNSKKVTIFEFPSNLGLKKKETEAQPGVRLLPHYFQKYQFHQQINPQQTFTLLPPEYSMEMDIETGVRNADKIRNYAIEQAKIIVPHLKSDHFLIILGGDCSILIGSALALKQHGTYGLFYLDGHTDFILPETSKTGGAAGMDLAIVTGYGHKKLTDINNLKPYFKEKNVWCVGNREYDPNYVKSILESEIKYYDLKTLRKTGIDQCISEFHQMVIANNLDGYFIHLDVDVLNDNIMPAVDSRQVDGLNYSEFENIMEQLLSNPKAVGLEITILDPTLDPEGFYSTDFIRYFVKTFKNVKYA